MNSPRKTDNTTMQVIIQCSACQTKFALTPDLIGDTPNPRFHCSRCDHVFTAVPLKPIQAAPPKTVQVPVQNYTENDKIAVGAPIVSRNHEPPQTIQQELFKSPSWSKKPSSASATSQTSRSLDIPKSVDSNFRVRPPHEGYDDGDLQEALNFDLPPDFELDDPNHSYENETPPSTERYQLDKSRQMKDPIDYDSTKRTPFIEEFDQIPSNSKPLLDRSLNSYQNKGKIRSKWSYLFIPQFALVAILLILTWWSFLNPLDLGQFLYSTSETLPRNAPAGLFIDQTKIEKIILDDGNKVYLISGSIKNTTEKPVSEIKIEGTIFNEQRELIGRLIVPVGSAILKSRIKSLSVEMVRALAASKSADSSPISPAASAEFMIPLIDSSILEPGFYSARIYSVN